MIPKSKFHKKELLSSLMAVAYQVHEGDAAAEIMDMSEKHPRGKDIKVF